MLLPRAFVPGFGGPTNLGANQGAFPMSSGGVTASSFASGNQAISVSRVGDQISLEMYIPGVSPNPIRLRGTPAQIETQLKNSDLSQAAKQAVRRALGG